MKKRTRKNRRWTIAFSCFLLSAMVFSMLMVPLMYNQLGSIDTAEAGKFGNITPTSFELQLLEKINENRSANGAGPLSLNTSLWWIARAHSRDMIDYDFFEHSSSSQGQFNGASFSQRIRNYADYSGSLIGECIAWNSWGPDPEWCMSTWKGSSGHWNIIIDPDYTEIGLGIIQGEWDGWSNSGLYTADFGGYSLSVDLVMDESDIQFNPSSPQQDEQVIISTAIHNQGSTDTYPVSVRFYDGDPDLDGVLIENEVHIPHILIHGESVTVNITWDTTEKTGNHDIYVVVDPTNSIYETNENNNKAYKSINLGPEPNPSIHLSFGWNLVSFPYLVSDTNLDSVLSSIDGEYDMVQYYDSSDSIDSWKSHHSQKPSILNDISYLDNEKGFWIHVTKVGGTDLIVSGSAPSSPQSITLHSGWNLVGYPSTTSMLRACALNNLDFGTQILAIQYFNQTTKSFENIEDSMPIVPEFGYFIFATKDCEWIVN
jgi:uncharacterized protein YkwD